MPAESLAIAYDCLYPFTTGGGERQYRGFAERMAARGRRVVYLTARQWDAEGPGRAGFDVRAVTGRLRLYDGDGVRRSAAALGFAWGLFRYLFTHRGAHDAVLVSGLPVLNVLAARAALLGSRTVVATDFLEVWGRRQWREYAGAVMGTVAWALQRAAIAMTPLATCHSQLSASRLRAEGFRGPLLVSPGLIDAEPNHETEGDTSASDTAARTDAPFVLYAGRHIPDKRVESLPAAVAAARDGIPDLRLIVLGTGPTTPRLREAIARAGGEGWTELPGFVTDAELQRLMAGAACLVNPSKREGYGLVVVEAAAHGTPVVLVADEGNAATELIVAGANGFVAESTDAAHLAEAIATAVAGGPDLRASTRAWYDDAVRTRTVDRTVGNILAALDTMIDRPGDPVSRREPLDPEQGHP